MAFSFVLGYHGCDRKVGEALLAGKPFQASQNDYDWLGPGIYFWEANPKRALDFARDAQTRAAAKIKDPFVVGAVLELGYCLDLATLAGVEQVRIAFRSLQEGAEAAGRELPKNSNDQLRRNLDCAVIKRLHSILADLGSPAIDTVRGVFVEGEVVYSGSGFHEKTHVQIAVRNMECVKGVFRVPERDLRG